MATRTFTATSASDVFTDTTKWDGGTTLPSAGDDLVFAGGSEYGCLLTANDSTVYGTVTINQNTFFNIQTYNFSCGAVTITAGTAPSGAYSCTNTSGSSTYTAVNIASAPLLGANITGTGVGASTFINSISGSANNYTFTTTTVSTGAVTTINISTNPAVLVIGTSSGTGLTCTALTIGNYSRLALSSTGGSIINIAGNFTGPTTVGGGLYDNTTVPFGTVSNVAAGRGKVTFTSSGTYSQPIANTNIGVVFNTITVDAGVTLTCGSTTTYIGGSGGESFSGLTLNGTIALGTKTLHLGGTSSSTHTFGVNCDITGSGTFLYRINNSATINMNKTTVFSLTGNTNPGANSLSNRAVLPGRWDNSALYLDIQGPVNSCTWNFKGDSTYKAIYCRFASTNASGTSTVKDNGYTITCLGEFDANKQSTTNDSPAKNSWTNGNGTIILSSAAPANVNFANYTMCNISILSSSTLTFMNDFSCPSFTGTSGTIALNTYSAVTGQSFAGNNPVTITSTAHGLRSGQNIAITNSSNTAALANGTYAVTVVNANSFTIPFNGNNAGGTCDYTVVFNKVFTVTNAGSCVGVTFPAGLSFGALKKINNKGGTNPGGTTGIVFRDKAKYSQ